MRYPDFAARCSAWLQCCGLHHRLYLAAALVVVAAALLTGKNIDTLVARDRGVLHSHEVSRALQSIQIELAAAEALALETRAGRRRLTDLERARERVWAAVAQAEQLTLDDATQRARFKALRAAMLATLSPTEEVEAHHGGGRAAAAQDAAKDEVRRQIAVMASDESDALTLRMADADRARIAASAGAAITGALGMTLVILLGHMNERERRRMRGEAMERGRAEHGARGREG